MCILIIIIIIIIIIILFILGNHFSFKTDNNVGSVK